MTEITNDYLKLIVDNSLVDEWYDVITFDDSMSQKGVNSEGKSS
jgi:hypothetical protein